MDATKNPPKLTIQDLPSELLFEILEFIQDDSELDNVQQVCCRWHSLIDEWLGRVVSVSTQRVLHPSHPEVSKVGLELISEIGVSELCIEESPGSLDSPPSPLPAFKRPYLLRRLHLQYPLHPELFSSLVKDTVNLSEFWISLSVLAKLREADLQNLNFPMLTTLTLGTHGADEEPTSLPNLRTVLKENRFRKLRNLTVHFSVKSYQDLETLKVLMTFIQSHRALKDISVVMTFPIGITPLDLPAYQEDNKFLIRKIKECRHSLKKLYISGRNIPTTTTYPHLEIWKKFVENHSSLETLILCIGPLSNEFLNTVSSRNASTMQTLGLNQYRDAGTSNKFRKLSATDGPLDCSALSPLRSLSMLELNGCRVVTGTRHLPPSLTNISGMASIPSDDMDHILLHLPNLRILTLYNKIDREEGYSVKLETVNQFIRNRQMTTVLFSTDGTEYPQEGLPNGDPANPEMLILKNNGRGVLNFVLNSDGYYTTTGASARTHTTMYL